MTTRVMPGVPNMAGTANGRTYQTATYLDVPDWDAGILTANGWVGFGCGMLGASGPTASRPAPGAGSFLDTTLGEIVTWVPVFPLAPGNLGRWVNYLGATV